MFVGGCSTLNAVLRGFRLVPLGALSMKSNRFDAVVELNLRLQLFARRCPTFWQKILGPESGVTCPLEYLVPRHSVELLFAPRVSGSECDTKFMTHREAYPSELLK